VSDVPNPFPVPHEYLRYWINFPQLLSQTSPLELPNFPFPTPREPPQLPVCLSLLEARFLPFPSCEIACFLEGKTFFPSPLEGLVYRSVYAFFSSITTRSLGGKDKSELSKRALPYFLFLWSTLSSLHLFPIFTFLDFFHFSQCFRASLFLSALCF